MIAPSETIGPSGTTSTPFRLQNHAGRRTVLLGLDRLTPSFARSLQEEGFQTTTYGAPEDAFDTLQSTSADLVILGSMSGPDSFAAVSTLRSLAPKAFILCLVPSTDPDPALRAMLQGADDVVAPPHSVGSVLLRARLLFDLRSAIGHGRPRAHGRSAPVVVDPSSRLVMDMDHSVNLTGRESELLQRLLDARGRVVTRDDLLEDIWGRKAGSEAVLDATVHRLRQKLEPDPGEPRILITVRGVGYRLDLTMIEVAEASAAEQPALG